MKKKNDIDKIFLDELGMKQLTSEILKSQEKIDELIGLKKELLKNGEIGSMKYQTVALALEKEKSILKGFMNARKKVEIVENAHDENIVNIGDIICADLIFAEDDIEEITFKLVVDNGNLNVEPKLVTINSPIGRSVLNQQVGETVPCNTPTLDYQILIKYKKTLSDTPAVTSR